MKFNVVDLASLILVPHTLACCCLLTATVNKVIERKTNYKRHFHAYKYDCMNDSMTV